MVSFFADLLPFGEAYYGNLGFEASVQAVYLVAYNRWSVLGSYQTCGFADMVSADVAQP